MEKSRENLFYYNFWLEFRIYHSISKPYYLSKKKSCPVQLIRAEQGNDCTWVHWKGNWKILQIFWGIKVFEIFWKCFANILANQSVWKYLIFFLKIFWQIVLHCKNDFCNQFTAVDGDIVITGASNYSKCQLQYRALIVTIPRRCWW